MGHVQKKATKQPLVLESGDYNKDQYTLETTDQFQGT